MIKHKTIPKLKNEAKTIYKIILQKGSQNHIIFGETQWKNKLQNIDFTKILKKTYCSYSQPHTCDLLYQLLHYSTITKDYSYKISRDKKDLKPNCKYCNKTRDNLHLFTQWTRIQNMWEYFQPIYQKLTTKQYSEDQHILRIIPNNTNSMCKKLILTLTQLILYEI